MIFNKIINDEHSSAIQFQSLETEKGKKEEERAKVYVLNNQVTSKQTLKDSLEVHKKWTYDN